MKFQFFTKALKYRKILISFFFLISILTVHSDDIGVSARVGLGNSAPSIISISPAYSPIVVENNSVQLIFLQIGDIDGDTLSYTITPENGAASPLNGTLSNTQQLISGNAYINFIYLSSSNLSNIGPSQVTLTLNDGINPVVIKKLDIYTY